MTHHQQQQQHDTASSTITAAQPRAVDLSPLALVLCTRCRTPYHSSPNPFWLTTCGHTTCSSCTFPNQSTLLPSDDQLQNLTLNCPACSQPGQVVRLAEDSPLDEELACCFRPLTSLLGDLGMSLQWQMGNIVEQRNFYRDKHASHKETLSKLGAELRKMKGLRSQIESLTNENALLRSQLAAAQGRSTPRAAPTDLAEAPGSGGTRSHYSDPGTAGGGASSRKRRANSSPDRAPTRGPPQNSRPPSGAPTIPQGLPLQPARLSLPPRQSTSRQQGGSSRLPLNNSIAQNVQRPPSVVQDGRSPREKLANYAYDPQRSRSTQPLPLPTQSLTAPITRPISVRPLPHPPPSGPTPFRPQSQQAQWGQSYEPQQQQQEQYYEDEQGYFDPESQQAGGFARRGGGAMGPPPTPFRGGGTPMPGSTRFSNGSQTPQRHQFQPQQQSTNGSFRFRQSF